MILGSDFIEERLFAFRDYVNLTEEGIKSLKKERSNIARVLKHKYDNLKRARDSDRKKIVRECGGDINKVIDLLNKREFYYPARKDGTMAAIPNLANPAVFEEAVNTIRKRAHSDARCAGFIARGVK